MTEEELVAETIATIKRDGWAKGVLFNTDTRHHCILGAIGRARWGAAWDIDCMAGLGEPYSRLIADPLTDSLVKKVAAHLRTNIDSDVARDVLGYNDSDLEDDSLAHDLAMDWNDQLLDDEEELLDMLEKVQAEIGVE